MVKLLIELTLDISPAETDLLEEAVEEIKVLLGDGPFTEEFPTTGEVKVGLYGPDGTVLE